MLIAQITDTHLGFEPGNPHELNTRRFAHVLEQLAVMEPQPDLIVVSGDLTERGDRESYERFREMVASITIPMLMTVGNHDRRANFRAVFPDAPANDGFIQFVHDQAGRRIIMLDTLDEGRHGGAFCERRGAWLDARLREQPDTPTLLVLHHPPVDTGIDWMDTHPAAPWAARLAGIVRAHPQVTGLIAGHIHRPIAVPWAGSTLTVSSSTAPQVALDLRPVDPADADGRALIVREPPGYALHRWTEAGLVTHFGTAGEHTVMARYDPYLQPMIAALMAEKPAP